MKGPLYISDDGQKEGTREEVEAYEASLNPLAKFKFPWHLSPSGMWANAGDGWAITTNAEEVIDLLNLMPLVEELRQTWIDVFPTWRECDFGMRDRDTARRLLLAYEKALGAQS